MKIEEKKQIVDELREKFSRSKVVIVTDYKGLDVTAITQLRRVLREAGVEYRVVKNSLLVRASEQTGVAPLKEAFRGPSAVAMSFDDPVAPAKVLTKFADENDKLQIRTGVLDGRILDLNAIKALSKLPGREELLARLLSVLQGVPTAFVRALSDLPRQLLTVLTAVKEQKEAS